MHFRPMNPLDRPETSKSTLHLIPNHKIIIYGQFESVCNHLSLNLVI